MPKGKSGREGTGKKHKCEGCDILIPLYKKYCNRLCYFNSNRIEIICKYCGNSKILPKNRNEQEYCSTKCSNSAIDRKETKKKAQNTLLNKYGTSNPFEVFGYENMNILRNGEKISKTATSKNDEEKNDIKEKQKLAYSKKSQKEKDTIREKIKNTNLELYGVEYTLEKNSPFRKEAEFNSRIKKWEEYNEWLLKNDLILLDKFIGVKDKKGNIIYYNFKHIPSGNKFIDHLACGRLPIYKDPDETIGISRVEKEIQNFIKDSLPTSGYIFNNRKLVKGFEIDIYFPHNNFAIELNGNRWHSELMGKNRLYHLNKTKECEKQNIQLIHIFEDEWNNKKEIVKSRILNLLNKTPNKIYARKCIIREVCNSEKNKFLNQNHIQGEDKSKYKFGLYYNNELVSIMTFGNLRKITGNKSKEDYYELIRFCTKLNTNIIGGFSKLLTFFIKTQNPKQIISYADRRWSQGKLYESNKFEFIKNTPPNYWYMKYYKIREHRYKYRKSELSKILPIFNPSLSEWENMKNNKYDRIWDCGSKKYVMNL